MGIFNLFGKKKEILPPVDLSVLKTDVHSHFLPGIDDGAQTMEDTIALLKEFQQLGYKKVITTPHVMIDYYKNTSAIILQGLDNVRNAMVKENVSIEIEASAEYFLDNHFMSLIEKKDLLDFGNKYVLFELSFMHEGPLLPEAIFQLQMNGYKPILAHVERYNFWHHDYENFHKWKDKGVYFQLNINSVTNHYGPLVKKAAEYMIQNNMYDFLGSDCHHLNHVKLTHAALKEPLLYQVVNSGTLLNYSL